MHFVEIKLLAERQGFEPWVPFQVHRISSATHSTTLAPLQNLDHESDKPTQTKICKSNQTILPQKLTRWTGDKPYCFMDSICALVP